MTVRTNSVQTCDRCEKPFSEKHLKAADVVPTFKQRGLVVTETRGTNKDSEPKFTVVISFDDMCPDCQKSVDNLIAKLRLDGKKKKRDPAKKRGAKKEKVEAPKTREYSENPEDAPEDGAPAEAKTDAPAEEKTDEANSEEASEAQEASPPAEEVEAEGASAEEAPAENSDDGGNGAEAASADDERLVEDPTTGDKYDPDTGEVVVKGQNGEQEKHPF